MLRIWCFLTEEAYCTYAKECGNNIIIQEKIFFGDIDTKTGFQVRSIFCYLQKKMSNNMSNLLFSVPQGTCQKMRGFCTSTVHTLKMRLLFSSLCSIKTWGENADFHFYFFISLLYNSDNSAILSRGRSIFDSV